jgi:nucleoid-associated protein YgaU
MFVRPSHGVMCIALLLGAALPCPSWAQENFMTRLFTFREEQKDLVRPSGSRGVPPLVMLQPHYPADEHVAWSNFYTRKDLAPENYLGDPATKVMRPKAQELAAATPAQAMGGWPAIAEQAQENDLAARDQSSNVIIGEPGEGPGMMAFDGKLGAATRVGEPVRSWRDTAGPNLGARPGDFDYRLSDTSRAVAEIAGGEMVSDPASRVTDAGPRMAERAGDTAQGARQRPDPRWQDDLRYKAFDDNGLVSEYAVQKGDTLGGIAGQEAIYGQPQLWPLIYSANRKAIGPNPHALKKGQELEIPRNYTEEQAKDAMKRAGKLGR